MKHRRKRGPWRTDSGSNPVYDGFPHGYAGYVGRCYKTIPDYKDISSGKASYPIRQCNGSIIRKEIAGRIIEYCTTCYAGY